MRFIIFLFTAASLFAQCDDIYVPPRDARRSSEVVFRGTVEGFRGTGTDRTVIFRVNRVWKGPVGSTFEMLAAETTGAMCNAFWKGLMEPGNELVVYASRKLDIPKHKDYLPIRGKSMLVRQATDIGALGRGRKPRPDH
jgi:hypothetical protein